MVTSSSLKSIRQTLWAKEGVFGPQSPAFAVKSEGAAPSTRGSVPPRALRPLAPHRRLVVHRRRDGRPRRALEGPVGDRRVQRGAQGAGRSRRHTRARARAGAPVVAGAEG